MDANETEVVLQQDVPRAVIVTAAISYIALIFLIILGNTLVLASFITNAKLRAMKTNHFIVSLAAGDILIGVVSLPLWTYYTLTEDYSNIALYRFYHCFDLFSGVASIIHLVAISMERCYALRKPFHHLNVKQDTITVILVVAWTLPVVISAIQLSNFKHYILILTVVCFLVPLDVIIITYCIMYKVTRKHLRSRGMQSFKKEVKVATTVAIVTGCFFVCWLPLFLVTILEVYCKSCRAGYDIRIILFIKWLQYSGSAVNPLIYGLRQAEYKRAYRSLLRRVSNRTSRLDKTSKFQHSVKMRKSTRRSTLHHRPDADVIAPSHV